MLRFANRLPDVIGLIDGYFFQKPAIHFKEILFALERGVRVLGASSMGALRASELDAFGMEGIGHIYQLYRNGSIDGDDEVAVLHSDEDAGFRPLTVPLVNVRHNVQRARDRGVISRDFAAKVVASARALHFTKRQYDVAIEAVHVEAPVSEGDKLKEFIRNAGVDLKCEDSLALIAAVADIANGTRPRLFPVAVKVRRTSFFCAFERQYCGHEVGGRHIPEATVLAFQKLLSPSFPALFRQLALRCLALDEATHRGLACDDREVLLARFRKSKSLQRDEAYRRWLEANYMRSDELAGSLCERDLVERLLRLYRAEAPGLRRSTFYRRVQADVVERTRLNEGRLTRPLIMRPGIPWDGPLLREMKLRGEFGTALQLACRILEFNVEVATRNPAFVAGLTTVGLRKWFAMRWGTTGSDVESAIFDRGFRNHDEFVATARLAFMYDSLGRGLPNDAPSGPSENIVSSPRG